MTDYRPTIVPHHLVSRFDMVEASAIRCRLNRDGYDWHGAYWGVGAPLWAIHLEDVNGMLHTHYKRSMNETNLAKYIREEYPNATLHSKLQERLACVAA